MEQPALVERSPQGARLALDVKTAHDAVLFFELQDNNWNAFPGQKKGQYFAQVNIKGSDKWQTVGARVSDFKLFGKRTMHPLKSWRHITELGIRGRVKVQQGDKEIELPMGKPINWKTPRNFRNLRWKGGEYRLGANMPD